MNIFKNVLKEYQVYLDFCKTLHIVSLVTEKEVTMVIKISKLLPRGVRFDFLKKVQNHSLYGRPVFVAVGYSLQEIWDDKNKRPI